MSNFTHTIHPHILWLTQEQIIQQRQMTTRTKNEYSHAHQQTIPLSSEYVLYHFTFSSWIIAAFNKKVNLQCKNIVYRRRSEKNDDNHGITVAMHTSYNQTERKESTWRLHSFYIIPTHVLKYEDYNNTQKTCLNDGLLQ